MLHVDAYRLEYEREVADLGLDEAVVDGNVVIVEWPDGIEHCLPPVDLKIVISIVDQARRQISFSGESDLGLTWLSALQNAQRN
jgi:tRNA threonylcarbamoyladenosine biosynthesis protein TsaE